MRDKNERRSVCTGDRDKNIAIALKTLHRTGVDPGSIKDKLLTLDASLSGDSLEILLGVAPNEKELKELTKLQKDLAKPAKVILHHLCVIFTLIHCRMVSLHLN